jgi:hypothetical protein
MLIVTLSPVFFGESGAFLPRPMQLTILVKVFFVEQLEFSSGKLSLRIYERETTSTCGKRVSPSRPGTLFGLRPHCPQQDTILIEQKKSVVIGDGRAL